MKKTSAITRFGLTFFIAVGANIILMAGLRYIFTPGGAMLASSVINAAAMWVYFMWSTYHPTRREFPPTYTEYLNDINNFDFRTGKWKDGRDEV